jgi:hypothetical protein
MAAGIKQVSNGKCFVIAYYGYDFALSDHRLTGSGHLDLSSLLRCKDLDAVSSPYQYIQSARQPEGRMTVHGPQDSVTLRGKMWVVEDDSRTALSAPGNFDRYVTDATSTVNLLRRNLYTSMLKKSAMYYFDLAGTGWFGRNDTARNIAITDAIWGNTSHALSQWKFMLERTSTTTPIQPEVAIFVDELSAAARPLLGLGDFEKSLLQLPWQDIAGIGAPIRVYLLSDLLQSNFSAKGIKMAILLNAAMVSAKLRDAIKAKLQHANDVIHRTVAWVYAPALFDADVCMGAGGCLPNVSAASELVGMELNMSLSPSPLTVSWQLDNTILNKTWNDGGWNDRGFGPISPWLSCDSDTILGRYGDPGRFGAPGPPAVCLGKHSGLGSSTAVFVGAPRPPVSLWRTLAKTAGVHLYTADADSVDDGDTVHADAVETGGRGLLFHAGSGTPRARLVALPRMLTVVSEWGDVVCAPTSPCQSFSTPVLGPGASILYWVTV